MNATLVFVYTRSIVLECIFMREVAFSGHARVVGARKVCSRSAPQRYACGVRFVCNLC